MIVESGTFREIAKTAGMGFVLGLAIGAWMAKQVMEHFGYEWGGLGDAILADEKEQLSDLLDGLKEQQK